MRRVRLILALVVVFSMFGCSKFGKGGAGTADKPGFDAGGDGNIPLAQPGSEMPDVHFDFDSSALSSEAQSVLKDNAKWMLDNPGKIVAIEGHCDERGTSEYNLALGERRARSAYDYLRSLGVKKDQMSTVSYGEELPLDPAHNESAWAKNRRAHMSIKK